MSNSHLHAQYSAPSPDAPTPPDLAALAVMLQEAAQALNTFHSPNKPEEPKEPTTRPPVSEHEGETRSYYFPLSVVHLEKELLRKYRTNDFQGLLEKLYVLLVGLAKLMQNIHKDVRVRGYVIASLGANLEHASALVLRMRHVYGRAMPIQR